jgi:uncharacterized protein (UPF0261 family)
MSVLPIAISTGPLTRPCADAAGRLLGERGRLVRKYEADGQGGRSLEADVLAGRIVAVLDLTLNELVAEMLGRSGGAGLDRLTAAALRGIPQVIALGGLDAAWRFPINNAKIPGALFRRTSSEENDALGREIANKASAARGPTTILVPSRSVPPVLVQSLQNWISPHVPVRELDLHINDPAFAAAAVEALETELRP